MRSLPVEAGTAGEWGEAESRQTALHFFNMVPYCCIWRCRAWEELQGTHVNNEKLTSLEYQHSGALHFLGFYWGAWGGLVGLFVGLFVGLLVCLFVLLWSFYEAESHGWS